MCDFINMCDLEKAVGLVRSLIGIGICLFVPLSGK